MIEELYKQPAVPELSSFFSSKIKSRDKEKYDKSVLITLRGSMMACALLVKELDNHDKLSQLMMRFTNYQLYAEDFLKIIRGENIDLGELSDNRLINFGMSIFVKFMADLFPDMPKSGLFCTRNTIARDWLNKFYVHVTKQAEEYKLPYLQVLTYNIVKYLVSYHNETFYVIKDEYPDTYIKRIYYEFMALTDKMLKIHIPQT